MNLIKQLRKSSLIVLCLFFYLSASAQLTTDDYQRADSVMKLSELVYNQVEDINWIDSTSSFWYRVKTRDGLEYKLIDAGKKTKVAAFDSGKLVKALNQFLKKKRRLKNLTFEI